MRGVVGRNDQLTWRGCGSYVHGWPVHHLHRSFLRVDAPQINETGMRPALDMRSMCQ
jgi:hypothetical protein